MEMKFFVLKKKYNHHFVSLNNNVFNLKRIKFNKMINLKFILMIKMCIKILFFNKLIQFNKIKF